ncbi:MAG: DUF3887 domain-containing protein [Dehalococcoidales bacterium]|nr:DUF3887 domain-containing protein [Dehalococcoidales bacterium]
MKKIFSLISLLVIMSVLSGVTISCKSGPSTTPEKDAILAYADPATETTLQGLSENNLAKYTQYGNAQFKAAVTQEILEPVASQINSQLGAYESKEFLRTEEQQGYIIVHYKAKYAKGEVGVRMVFDTDHLVAGQFFE